MRSPRAAPASLPGLHTFRIGAGGIEVFAPARVDVPGDADATAARLSPRLSMGVPRLDAMLGGGLPRGYSLLVAAPSGAGKSILASAFRAEGARCGERGVIAAFEQRPNRARNRVVAELINSGQVGPVDSQSPDLSIDEVLHLLMKEIRRLGAARVVIDSLSGFELALAPTFREDFRESLSRLVTALAGMGVTVLMTSELEDRYISTRKACSAAGRPASGWPTGPRRRPLATTMDDMPGKELAAMNDETFDPEDRAAVAQAGRELSRLAAQIAASRALLLSLQRDVAAAESSLASSHAALLLESNERLVVAALRAQNDAVSTAIALDELAQWAEHDPLTQLPNRLLLLDRFSHAIAGAKRHGTQLALLFLDLDAFKPINDTHGHAAGDAVLKHVAACLSATVRGADTVSRHGGDEFLILLTDVSQPADAALTASKLLAAIAAPLRSGDANLSLTASIGISLYPDDGQEPQALIQLADAAMYRAKKHGRGGFAFHGDALAGDAIGP